jgi:hypothetical protein
MPEPVYPGVQIIDGERVRQVLLKGFSAEHDDRHELEELAKAAACYALPHYSRTNTISFPATGACDLWRGLWPWRSEDWKPETNNLSPISKHDGIRVTWRIEELAKAGALIAAEIDRLLRL